MYQKLNLRVRFIAITIAIAMVVVLFASYSEDAFANEPESGYVYQNEIVSSAEASYLGNYGDEQPLTYYYSDGYFKDETTTYNPHLATMSIVLSMTAMSRNKTWASNVLRNIGCTDIGSRDFGITPTKDTIAAVYGHKKIFAGTSDEAELIPVVVRGGFYGKEWINNFTVGKTGDTQGFDASSDKVLNSVRDYMSSNSIPLDEAIFWVMGYSRGGTVANLVGRKLSDIAEVGQDSVYAYSFEAQKVAYNNAKTYNNLNVVSNVNDFLTCIIPTFSSTEKFSYYGKEKIIGDVHNDKYSILVDRMQSQIKKIATMEDGFADPAKFKYYRINPIITRLSDASSTELLFDLLLIISGNFKIFYSDSSSSKTKGQRDCADMFVKRAMQRALQTREAYTDNSNRYDKDNKSVNIEAASLGETPYNLEQTAEAIINFLEDTPQGTLDDLGENFQNFPIADFAENNFSKIQSLIKYLKTMKVTSTWNDNYATMVTDIWNILNTDSGDYLGFDSLVSESIITAEQEKELKAILPIALYTVAAITSYDIGQGTETIASIINNFDSIAQAHYEEVNFAWLTTEDTFYFADAGNEPMPEKDPEPKPQPDPKPQPEDIGETTGNPEEQPEPIEPEPIKIVKPAISKLIAGKKMLTVKWKKKTSISGYQLQYSTTSTFNKSSRKTITVSKSKTSYKVKKLKSHKKYYVRMRCYKKIDGKPIYSDWSSKKSIKTK